MRFALVFAAALAGCAYIMPEKKQDPFPTMDVKATRPAPGPDRVVLTASNITIMDKVQFETGKAALKPESFSLLDEVVKVMKSNPQIELVEIDGHTDATGA